MTLRADRPPAQQVALDGFADRLERAVGSLARLGALRSETESAFDLTEDDRTLLPTLPFGPAQGRRRGAWVARRAS
jgi:hypothetical protein